MSYNVKKSFVIAIALLVGSLLIFLVKVTGDLGDEQVQKQRGLALVTMNEMKQLIGDIPVTKENEEVLNRLTWVVEEEMVESLQPFINLGTLRWQMIIYIGSVGALITLFLLLLFHYIDKKILRPFRELEAFAGRIAEGRYDVPLTMERKNIFGAFTKAFDMMRHELKKAREREEASVEAKKTLVATLSHDIKTPVASIRAYAERLNGSKILSEEKQERYLAVIMKKADELTKLTDDLFLHTLSDMDKLAFNCKSYGSKELLEELLLPLYIQYDDKFRVIDALPSVQITTDAARLAQIFSNILTNSEKYAEGSPVELSFLVTDGYLECTFQDYGEGVDPEDMPFIWDKFYRGKQAKSRVKEGAGLGLYIVRYIMDKTEGYVRCRNKGGFQITIGIKRVD